MRTYIELDRVMFCVSAENLECRLTLEAGYQCQCEINGVFTPLNGTECISACSVL